MYGQVLCEKNEQFFRFCLKPLTTRFCLLLSLALYLPMGGYRVRMRKVCFSLSILLVLAARTYGQLGHEWINFGQPYYKIPVARDGIYRVSASALQSAGFPLSSVDPTRIQLFHRGIEQAIYVEGEGDLTFNNADYIEFYGRKNDGTLDAQLYQTADKQPHSYYNLYSDTTSYFLTVGSLPGKRMTSYFEENTGGIPLESFGLDEKLLVLTSQYGIGIDFGNVQETSFGLGEGWTGNQIALNQFVDYSFTGVLQGAPAARQPSLEVLVVGRGPADTHQVEIYVGTAQRLIASGIVQGFATAKFTQEINWSDIDAAGNLVVRIKVVGGGDATNQPRISASYLKLSYPKQLDVAGAVEKTFRLAANPSGKSYIELQNPPAGLRIFDITDPANPLRIGTTTTTTLNAVIPYTDTERKIYATNTTISPTVKPVSFRQIIPAQHNYIIISHPLLRKPAAGYSDPVKAYAEYRASVAGGSYDTLVMNIQQLYDQYNYGESSPLAIIHFMKFLDVNRPDYLLLIGKGLDVYYQYFRYQDHPAYASYKDLIPSAGFPASDMFYTAGLPGTIHEPAVPTGRISTIRPEDVAAYLDKVKEMEALPYDGLWRKNLLHLSGGIAEDEPDAFKFYMQGFQAIAEDYYLGGKVSAIAKRSVEIQEINVAAQVNSGLSLMTFFGHSSTTTTDFEIGYATDPLQGYNNKGKYPILLLNGCNAGSFFINQKLMGEDWLLAKDRGAAGFIAHSAYGLVGNLRHYTETFYSVGFGDSTFLRKGIGEIQKETARRYLESSGYSPSDITQAQQMILLGDPAYRLFGGTKADLEINDNSVRIESFDGQPISAAADSFAVNMIIRNFGQARRDTIRIEVVRTLHDGTVIVYDSLYRSTMYSDTVTLVIRKGRETSFGNNTFQVTIDPDNILPELSETNNVATKSLFIGLNGTKNLYPLNFGIQKSTSVNLTFQATDVQAGEQDFLVQLDTVNTFDSPFRKSVTITADVVAKQAFTLLDSDTLAYYWRTKRAVSVDTVWTQSSFTYIKDGSDGWAQVHFPQYLENQTDGLVADAALRKLHFRESTTPVAVKTFGGSHPAPFTDVSVKIAGAEYNLYGPGYDCRDNSFNLIAFDRKSTVPYSAVRFEWYNRAGRNCGRKPWVINNYVPSQMVTGDGDLITYINNVATGDSVLMYSIGDAQYSLWPAAAKTKLGELGVSVAQLDALQNGEPVIIMGRKGTAPGTAKFYKTTDTPKNMGVLNVPDMTVTGGYTSGRMNSGIIGPAIKWDSLITRPTEIETIDKVSFDLIGVKLNQEEQVILKEVNGDQDLGAIDAGEFPYLKIVFNSEDNTNLSSAQLSKWILLYTPSPEGLLLYYGTRQPVTIEEGKTWKGDYGFLNVRGTFSDSLTVRYEVFNQISRSLETGQTKIFPPGPEETTNFSIEVNTANKGGLNDVEVFVNPRIVPEQYYDNNDLLKRGYLNVLVDSYNPVLDVTVDGRHLISGDFVSPNPIIEAQIWDENPYLLKTDTTGVRIFLTYPCTAPDKCQAKEIFLTRDDVVWRPATDASPFSIEFTPKSLPEGEYLLRIEVTDARGNLSGAALYEVAFLIESDAAVEISDPYPNPFMDAAYVTVVVRGSNVPEHFEWRITNINGQLQNQFETEDFPAFHIGTNELTWKGTDLNGNLLPSGIYIYTLKLTLGGIPTTKTGKLVLVR